MLWGRAGYFGKVVLELARTLSLSKTVSDCNTKHLLEIEVKNKKMLAKYDGRYYKENEYDDLKVLDASKDKDLIGKTLLFRSPVTCACKDEICHKCFGRTSLLNIDIADGVAGFEVEEWTKEVEQRILSAKHLLTTISERIQFNDDFDRFFNLCAGEINPIISESTVEDLDDWAIYIEKDSIQKSVELDDDSSFNNYIETGFYVMNTVTKEKIWIHTDEGKEIYLTDECLSLLKRNMIKFKDLSDDTTLFEMIIMNGQSCLVHVKPF